MVHHRFRLPSGVLNHTCAGLGNRTWRLKAASTDNWFALLSAVPPTYHISTRALQQKRLLRAQGSSTTQERYALFIDGDTVGPSSWASVIDAVRRKGQLAHAQVYCPAAFCQNRVWTDAAAALNIEFKVVKRRVGGAKDPNDMAIAMAAQRVVSTGAVRSVALAVGDVDFAYVADCLHSAGHNTLAVLPEGSSNRMARAFTDAGAEVARFKQHHSGEHAPKKKLILHPSGVGSVRDVSEEDLFVNVADEGALAERLLELGFLSTLDDPLVPGLAKLYCANRIGDLTVWPTVCALQEAETTVLSLRQQCRTNPGDLVFVLPMTNGKGSKACMDVYGSINCARFASAGGPFILKDTDTLVARFLQKLKYLDDGLNADLGEAIDVFCRAKLNRRALAKLGLQVAPLFKEHTKTSLLHGALVSPSVTGTWQVAPSDMSVRMMFARQSLISGVDAPARQVFKALKTYVHKHGLQQRNTYNGLVFEVLHSQQQPNSAAAFT